ncbi:glycoside hydrolase family 76 protein [Subtercola sp. Z020]|uniref:glycoside hydrolase family 76 protein n=1 Tax=Subtercola sp. Z020 TaxID=2080582 RepID=UPI00130EA04D|nr:glycoside hydrolase family 76 protein [Subtercola sp. Z020]
MAALHRSGAAVTGGGMRTGGDGRIRGDAGAGAKRGGGDAGAGASWSRLADGAQQSLTDHFQSRLVGARWLHNTSPLRLAQLATFNYWWLAHAVEVRVDGAERRGTGGGPDSAAVHASAQSARTPSARARIALAEKTYAGILCRNRGLFNHYFDDMGWLALAAVRLFDATGSERYLADAEALWEHIREKGGSRERPGAIAWRDTQLDYLNAPTNGAFAILSARLATRVAAREGVRAGAARYAAAADESLEFFTRTLVAGQQAAIDEGLPPGPADLVADGLNRQGDGALDTGWLFSYNQGLYVGALVEAFDRTADAAQLDRAVRTAVATLAALAPSGRFVGEPARLGERGGGDAGLFKGIFLRYLELLLERLPVDGEGFRMLAPPFTAMTDLLAAAVPPPPVGVSRPTSPLPGAYPPVFPLVDDDWAAPPAAPARTATRTTSPRTTATRTTATGTAAPTTALTTQLAAVMAVEARARFELHRASRTTPPH